MSIFRVLSELRRIIDTFVEITVNKPNVKANIRKMWKIEKGGSSSHFY